MSAAAVPATTYAFNSCPDTSVRPRTIPSIWVVPIFFVTDQQIPTGSIWNTASPISHRKLSIPAQNWLISHNVFVPFSNKYKLSIQFRKPRINPPVIIAGMSGAKISASAVITLCSTFWFFFAACFTASFDTPSIPASFTKSL